MRSMIRKCWLLLEHLKSGDIILKGQPTPLRSGQTIRIWSILWLPRNLTEDKPDGPYICPDLTSLFIIDLVKDHLNQMLYQEGQIMEKENMTMKMLSFSNLPTLKFRLLSKDILCYPVQKHPCSRGLE